MHKSKWHFSVLGKDKCVKGRVKKNRKIANKGKEHLLDRVQMSIMLMKSIVSSSVVWIMDKAF